MKQKRNSTSAASSHDTTRSDKTVVVSPQTPEAHELPDMGQQQSEKDVGEVPDYATPQGPYTHPIDTSIRPPSPSERTTPRAHTRQEVEEESRRRSRVSTLAGK